MSEFSDRPGLRSLLPAEPGRWLWARLRIYLLVLVSVVVGFFFVADWQGHPAPDDAPELAWQLRSISELGHAIMLVIVSLAWAREWRSRSGKPGHGQRHP